MGTLTDDGVEVSGAVVTRDRSGATLPLTGLAVSTLVLLAAVLLGIGRLGVEWGGRADRRV